MMGARAVSVDIAGLNLLLGGGVFVLRRKKELEESTSVLFRGPPGSGKTVFGLQLAGSLARSFQADVAYGCVEILPTELAAQHAGILREGVRERVVIAEVGEDEEAGARFPQQGEPSAECRIFAATLDIGERGEEQERILPAVESVLDEIEQAGGRVRVLVLDSLSDGYNLGSQAPRILADEICKTAAMRGMVVILLEETVEEKPSAWSFATDVVMELRAGVGQEEAGQQTERMVRVAKNRFGPSDPGRHPFVVLPRGGIRVYPEPWVYTLPWAYDILSRGLNITIPDTHQSTNDWYSLNPRPEGFPSLRDSIVGVAAHDPSAAYLGALAIGHTVTVGVDIVLEFGQPTRPETRYGGSQNETLYIDCSNAYIHGSVIIADTIARLFEVGDRRTRRVLIGYLSSLKLFRHADEIMQSLIVLTTILRKIHVPTIFYTTIPFGEHVSLPHPAVGDFIDVSVYPVKRADKGGSWIDVSMLAIRSGIPFSFRTPA